MRRLPDDASDDDLYRDRHDLFTFVPHPCPSRHPRRSHSRHRGTAACSHSMFFWWRRSNHDRACHAGQPRSVDCPDTGDEFAATAQFCAVDDCHAYNHIRA
jgi:hypothetical protein